ncbi:MAG: S26 family signal peptidase [Dehalococcoidia bacterium]
MSILRLLSGLLGRISPVSRYIVDGPSMEPAYRAGNRLIVNRLAYLRRPPAIGDVVVLRDPQDDARLLIKRVAPAPDGARPRQSRIWVLGDNAPESRDSRTFGFIDRRRIVGKAWLRY